MLYKQVCRRCGSDEVARCQWVNVNNNEIYHEVDSGTTLEWCMNCEQETTIIDAEDFVSEEEDEDDELS